jgi:transcriptional regulator with GAF, ATPase, and Fis domain
MPHVAACPKEDRLGVLVASSNGTFRKRILDNIGRFSIDISLAGEAQGGADALAQLESSEWQTLLLDRRLSDLDPHELMGMVHDLHPQMEILLMDSGAGPALVPGQEPHFPRSMPLFELLQEIGGSSTTVPEPASEREEQAALPCPVSKPLPDMIGASEAMNQVYRKARLVAGRNATVLLTGETGTGKELVARGIHKISPRAGSPFVVVNCAAIPESLLEAELFGYARGAFTGAFQSRLGRVHTAHSGVLFLDEVGDLPLSMQAKLLRFLQEGEVQRLGSPDVIRVDVRVIAATNADLLKRMVEGQFRQDLYYRIAVFPVDLPPLRERVEDIEPLARHFLRQNCRQANEPSKHLSMAAVSYLQAQSWPGNARELQHAVERAWIMAADEPVLHKEHFDGTC